MGANGRSVRCSPELVLVSGFSGIGKSSVVNELHKAIVPPRGLFVAGKFDQYKRDIPYATLAQAFQALVRQLLVKSEEDLAAWCEALLAALGAKPSEFTSHAGNVAAGIEEGLVPLYSRVSSDDEWDHYEGLYARAVERHLAAHPGDPDHTAMRDKIRGWREAYLEWGRETLGFGYYLFRTRAEEHAW